MADDQIPNTDEEDIPPRRPIPTTDEEAEAQLRAFTTMPQKAEILVKMYRCNRMQGNDILHSYKNVLMTYADILMGKQTEPPPPAMKYRHKKTGDIYRHLAVATDETDGAASRIMVVYCPDDSEHTIHVRAQDEMGTKFDTIWEERNAGL